MSVSGRKENRTLLGHRSFVSQYRCGFLKRD